MGILKYKAGTYWWKGTFEERELVRGYGFLWNEDKKLWYTKNPRAAWTFFNAEPVYSIDGETIQQLKTHRDSYDFSSHTLFVPANQEYKVPYGFSYLPFQNTGIDEIKYRKNILLADDMGLGKTIQAIGAINNIPGISKIFIVCPASVKLHWKRNIEEWCTKYYDTHIVRGRTDSVALSGSYDILLMNYALTPYYVDILRNTAWDLKIIDEVQYLMNEEAQRTKAVLGTKSDRTIGLSGSPAEKPIELWPLLKHLDPERWNDDTFWEFAQRYCKPRYDAEGRWHYDGAENLDELQDILRSTIMVRRTKAQVLPQLGEKQRTVIPLENDEFGELLLYEKGYVFYGDYENAIRELAQSLNVDGPYATIRREAGIAKVPLIIEYLTNCLKSTGKIVCYAYHKEVIAQLQKHFKDSCVTVRGGITTKHREAALQRFKEDNACKIYFGQIQAMGTGTDGLQDVANVGVFAELDWSYKNMVQAEDRLHRHGQKETAMYHYLVVDGSLEAYMAKKLQKKKEISNKMFDRKD